MKQRLVLSKDKFKIDINNPMYWTPKKILSYDFYLATVEGGRGIGKTTNLLGYLLNQHVIKGDNFVYIRRYKPEIREFVDPSKAPLDVIIDNVKYKGDGNGGYSCMYDTELFGYAIPLSTSKSYKSSKFKNVKWIVFDEFTLKRGSTQRYITDEVVTFLELVSTIVRTDTKYRIIFLGNNLDLFNPYFQFFKIPIFERIYFDKERKIVCERPLNSPQLIEAEKKTPLYKLVNGTAYGEYHYNNKILLKDKFEISEKPTNTRLFIRLVINDESLNIYLYNNKQGELGMYCEVKNKIIDDNYTYRLLDNGNNNLYYINMYRKRFYMYLQKYYGTNKVIYGSERAGTLFAFIMEEF